MSKKSRKIEALTEANAIRWNEIMVTTESGAGRDPGGFDELVTDYEEFGLLPDRGRNHASVVNQDSAIQVINWMRAVERSRGDLR